MTTTSDVKISAGPGVNIASWDITEDAETKKLLRIGVSDGAGVEVLGAVTASPVANTISDRLKTINTTLGAPLQAGGSVQSGQGASGSLNITTATVIKASAGRLVRVSVIVAGTASGTVNDCATTAAAAITNQIGFIAPAVGMSLFDWPCGTGIVVVPGTGQTLAVSYS